MSWKKRAVFFGLMAVLTLGLVEAMARTAWRLSHDEPYARESLLAGLADWADWADAGDGDEPGAHRPRGVLLHPYFGFTANSLHDDLNTVPPRPRREGEVLIGLLGGSVARQATPAFREALERYAADNGVDAEPVVIELSWGGMKQPQQIMVATWMLVIGGELDMIVNLDGHNELMIPVHVDRLSVGMSPYYPEFWDKLVEMTVAETALLGHIRVLRQEQGALLDWIRESRWFSSAAFGLVARTRLTALESEIRTLHLELAESSGVHRLERHGPKGIPGSVEELLRDAVDTWRRSSLQLARLAEGAGAEYVHFLQPSQYAPDAKPLTEWELTHAWRPSGHRKNWAAAYPWLLEAGEELRRSNVDYFDLTRIFSDNRETLYSDYCCHLNRRGYELLADAMLRRILETTKIDGLAPNDD